MSTPAIAVHNLTVAYQNKPALWNINATIPQGVVSAVIGPNGAGKSTLIKSIINLIRPISGTINVFGGTYAQHRNHIAYIPQRSSVDWDFPLTVFETVLMGRYGHLGWLRRPKEFDRLLTHQAIEDVNLTAYLNHPIGELSCGQQQRVFLARALVQDASLYLMDEPFIGIDANTEKLIINLLKKLARTGKTVIIVHHDLQTVHDYFDWVVLLNVELISCGSLATTFKQEFLRSTFNKTSFNSLNY